MAKRTSDEEEEVSPPDPMPPLIAFQSSPSLVKIAPALLAAQIRLKNPQKNSENPHFHSKFADLEACMDAAKAALNKEDIVLVQMFAPSGYGTVSLTTLAIHKSGEYIGGTATLPDDRGNAQGYGSAATYARRYGVSAILGMVAEDDDDGNAASASGESAPRAVRGDSPAKKLFGAR